MHVHTKSHGSSRSSKNSQGSGLIPDTLKMLFEYMHYNILLPWDSGKFSPETWMSRYLYNYYRKNVIGSLVNLNAAN